MSIPKPLRISLLTLLLACFLPLMAWGYWGLRRIDVNWLPSIYMPYHANYYAWNVHWGRTEPVDNQFNWTAFDRMLELTETNRSKTVVLINPSNQWATGGQARAPFDLDRSTLLTDPAPEFGYSNCLYDFTYKLVEHIAMYNPNLVSHLRFVNEPYFADNWNVTSATYEQDIEDYIRCLRTVYIAAHRAADDNNVDIKVGYGGLNYVRQLEREWYELGLVSPTARPVLLDFFHSRYERHFKKQLTWWDFEKWIDTYEIVPNCYWADMLAEQSEWVDCFEVHYHFKPRFIHHELRAFERKVLQAGGELKPWFASEAAMQLVPHGGTEFEERFHAGDMIKKWITGMAFGLEGICTPVIGYPPGSFYGLYDEHGEEYPAAHCYRFVRRLVPQPTHFKNISLEPVTAYRFRWNNKLVDVTWLDVLWDKDDTTEFYQPRVPNHFRVGRVLNIFGQEIDRILPQEGKIQVKVTQEPIIIVWDILKSPPPEHRGRINNQENPVD